MQSRTATDDGPWAASFRAQALGRSVADTIDPAGVDYTGHETDTFNFNRTNGAATTTMTFTPVTTGTDGTRLVGHEVGHVTVTADGTVTVSFDQFTWLRGCPLI